MSQTPQNKTEPSAYYRRLPNFYEFSRGLTILKLTLTSFPHSCSKFIGHIGSDHSNEALIDDVRLEVMRLASQGIGTLDIQSHVASGGLVF